MSQILSPTIPQYQNTLEGFPGKQLIIGPNFSDSRIQGTANSDYIITGQKKDIVSGLAGEDTIRTGEGDDSAVGGAGNDSIHGEQGKDTIFGGGDQDLLQGGKGNDQLAGGTGNDTIAGNDDVDLISGDEGDDSLFGNQGNDNLLGGAGNDSIYGGAGNDSIDGGDGDDFIAGDRGNDMLIGAAGKDTFVIPIDPNIRSNDTIVDFNPAEDKIALFSLSNGGSAPGPLNIGPTLDPNEFTVTNAGRDAVLTFGFSIPGKVIYDKASGLLFLKRPDGSISEVATLGNNLNVTTSNFEII